jgi:hypothetical protein
MALMARLAKPSPPAKAGERLPGHTYGVEPFGVVFLAIVAVGVVVAALSYLGSGKIYSGLGRTGLSLDEPEMRPGPAPGSPAATAEAREEVRQMLEAKSARRERRGEEPLDVEAEVEALMTPQAEVDPALREEIRQHVVARNERRVRRGQEPLDVETEIERQIRDFSG